VAGEKVIKARIKSINDTMQITKAMKLVSAAKLKQARNQLERAWPYFHRIEQSIAQILSRNTETENIYFDRRKDKAEKKSAFLILTGDKGLCGAYNNNIFKFAERYLKKDKAPILLVCGHSGAEHFAGQGRDMLKDFFFPVYDPTVFRAREIQEKVMELFRNGDADNVYLIFTSLKSSFTLVPKFIRLLPLTYGSMRKELKLKKIEDERHDLEFIYEPSMQEVFETLMPKYVKGIIYEALVEAFTSEQSARMTAMENATTNAKEIIDDLKLAYNRKRQNSITQEIAEIISGAEVLEGQ
jgi:F-type H+-transporting ATPase subunit gamma